MRHPSGYVTFLFTDIEGSTSRYESDPEAMSRARATHDGILRSLLRSHGGYVFKTVGDAFCAAFERPAAALQTALLAQRALCAEIWPAPADIRVRMALHTGVSEELEGDYFGPTLSRVARLLSAGHGGQILVSRATRDLLASSQLAGTALRDLGEHQLKDLFQPERIYQVVVPDLRSEFPALRTLNHHPNNLPVQPTSFVGRAQEVDAVAQRMQRDDSRLLTLIGTGGVGKTRLALQVAAELVEWFDGVYFIPLAPLREPSLVIASVARELHVKETRSQPLIDAVEEYLRQRRILLLVDNCEHLPGAGSVVAELLGSTPDLRVLATSRVPLHLAAEQEYPVSPLTVRDIRGHPPLEALEQNDAVALFIQRARAVRPDFALTENNSAAIVEICERLDGLPLAIELAAARIRMFPAQALLQRLQKRLTLLTSSAGDVPERQRTMRATIDWSYSLLTDAEQRLFARLGVFAGGCTIESAEAVCNSTSDLSIDVLEGLTLLVEKSLLRQEGEQESRFQMLETIREYAAERLTEQGDGPAQQEAHGRFYLDLAQKATPELRGADQLSWLDRLDADRDNLRAAIGWFRERKDERFLSFAMAMWRYWYTRGFFTEARGWLEAGISSWKEGPHDDQALLASALNAAGILAYALEDYKEARERYEEGLQLCREQGNQGGVAFALNNLGMVAQAEGRYEDARTLQEESLRQMRPLGDKEAIAGLLFHLGSLAQRQGRYGDARGIHEESLTLYRELGDTYGSAMSLNGLGEVAQQQKRYGDAQELYEESLRLKRELGDTFGIAVSLTGLGTLASAQDEHERATTLLAAASVQLASIGIALPPDHREWMEQALALARGTLSEPVYRAAWERGQATDAQGATNHAVE